MEDYTYRLISVFGFILLSGLAWITGTRNRIKIETILGSVVLAWALGALTFWFSGSRSVLEWINDVLISLLNASHKGAIFIFGPLALGPGQTLPDGTPSVGFVLAFQVFPSVIFFSALLGGLYNLGIMQKIVQLFSKAFHRILSLSGAESLAAAANMFVGIESGLTVRPYLAKMTRSELLTLMTCMMATVASTVMGIYVIALQKTFPNIAGHLVSASLISIPCAILISKLFYPELEQPETLGRLDEDRNDVSHRTGLMSAFVEGGGQGVKMAVSIATVLIIVLGLEALFDFILGKLPEFHGQSLSVVRMLGWLTFPFTVLLGLRPEEWEVAAQILGSRFIETEVSAYFSLAALQETNAAFTMRSMTIMTYALCGFVHISSMGIFVGGLSALVPSRANEISIVGLQALWTSFLATLLTGCIAGSLVI
ncbi:MAG: nucleoside permease nupX [Nitrospinae bacterium]|nr:nucleoside permease nupX [Nitrospinota bacterium]